MCPVAQKVKNLPEMWETWVWTLGWEDTLEKEMATHSSVLAWRIPWTEEPGRLQFMGSDTTEWLTHTHTHTHTHISLLGFLWLRWKVYVFKIILCWYIRCHSSVLACRIPGTGEPGGLPSMGSHRVGHSGSDLAAAARYYMRKYQNARRRQWHPTPVLLPGKSHGPRSLVGCSPWGR